MPRDYRVPVNIEALGALPGSGKRRDHIVSFIKGLNQSAHFGGDFEVIDPQTGRPFQVSVLVGFSITWWIDSPVAEVKVVDIRPTA